MSIFNRRRAGMDSQLAPEPAEDHLNLTNYVERTVIPTDGYNAVPSAQNVAPAASTTTAVRDNASDNVSAVERPMVFKSKQHPDMFIYEYSDRLEYYIRTASDMVCFRTEKKLY